MKKASCLVLELYEKKQAFDYDKTSCSGGGQASQAAVMSGVWASVSFIPCNLAGYHCGSLAFSLSMETIYF